MVSQSRKKKLPDRRTSLLDLRGRLLKKHLPAVYFDSSVLIDYVCCEELTYPEEMRLPTTLTPQESAFSSICKDDPKLNVLAKVRHALDEFKPRITAVYTGLGILELQGWWAENCLKQSALSSQPLKVVSKWDKKQSGRHLKKLFDARREESSETNSSQATKLTDLECFMRSSWLDPAWTENEMLRGLRFVEISKFQLDMKKVWGGASALSFLQLGAADIFHILFAQHLGCDYIVSFDSDFQRVQEVLHEEWGLRVVSNPKDLLALVSTGTL